MRYHSAIGVLALMLSHAAAAAPVAITVTGVDGRPLAGAVVTVNAPGVPPPAPQGTYAVAQQNIAFAPHILIVPVGATVAFPNLDKVRHHVYSFSKPKRFDLKLYGRETSRSVTFDKPGAVALGCNIHDAMNGFVFVTASRFTAITDAAGHVSWPGVPAGRATVAVWHPLIRAAGNTLAQPIVVAPSGYATSFSIRR